MVGGPAKPPQKKSATAYFYEGGFQPYGASWGAPFAPSKTCDPNLKPTPPPQTYCPPGSVQVNPDGTVVLDPDGQPIPCPGDVAPADCPPGSVQVNPDGTLKLGPDGGLLPCPDRDRANPGTDGTADTETNAPADAGAHGSTDARDRDRPARDPGADVGSRPSVVRG